MSSIKKKLGILGGLLLVLVLISAMILPASVLGQTTYPLQPTDAKIANALSYLHGQQTAEGDIGGFGPSAWVTMAIAAAGEDPHEWKVGDNPSIIDYLATNAGGATSATDYARMILAIVAAEEDPASFGGVSFVTLLKGQYDGTQIGDETLVNDDFWGVMALIAAGERPNSEIIQNSLSFIKSCQQPDNGWGFDIAASWGTDVDSTAAAIMALVVAGEGPSSDAVTNGLAYIKSNQMDNGGFESWGASNADTDSSAINAIVAAGQAPTSAAWTKNGNTPIDDVVNFQQGNGQFNWQTGDPGGFPCQTTAWAIQAILGKPYFTTVTTGLGSLGDNLVIAWGYREGEGIDGWTVYKPGLATNTLTLLHRGRGYWIYVNDEGTLVYGKNIYYLDGGWNLIGWLD
jgi:hypothetical protein